MKNSESDKEDSHLVAPKPQPYPMWFSTRLGVSLLGFLGCVMVCALRVNVSFAVVCMVNNTAVQIQEGIYNETEDRLREPRVEGSLVWKKSVQGQVVGSFYWGYAISQVIGGYVAGIVGGRLVIGNVVLISALLNLLHPLAANYSVYAFMALRFVLGVIQGAVLPAFHTFFSTWAPPWERGFLVSLTLAGINAGMILTMPLSGILCKYGFAGGWPSIFYVFGVMGLVWSVVWFIFSSDKPSKNRFIHPNEASYIETSLADVTSTPGEKRHVPWCAILTSVPVYATYCAHISGDWGAYMMQNCLPMFLSDNLGFPPSSLGTITAIPYVAYVIFISLGGMAADRLLNAGIMSTVNVRRLTTSIAIISQAVFLVAASYCGADQAMWAIVFVTVGTGISAIQYSGYVVTYLDLAPSYAGIMYGIGNTMSSVCGFGTPWLVGLLTPKGRKEEWQLVFWISFGIMVTGTIIYDLFASGKTQPWAFGDGNVHKEGQDSSAATGSSRPPQSSDKLTSAPESGAASTGSLKPAPSSEKQSPVAESSSAAAPQPNAQPAPK